MPYTSLNGHMFSLLTKEGWLALGLPSETRAAFLEKHQTKLGVQYGTVMKEYVRHLDVFLHHRSILHTEFGLVLLEERRSRLARESERQPSFLSQQAEHVTVQRRVRHGGAFALNLWIGRHQLFYNARLAAYFAASPFATVSLLLFNSKPTRGRRH